MTLKFFDLAAFTDAYQSIKDTSLPFALAYQLLSINKAVNDCIAFYRDQYNKLLEEYGMKNDDGTYKISEDGAAFLLKEETIQEARQKFFELDNSEFPIDVKPIPISALEKLNLSPSKLTGLLPFIEKDE